MAFDDAPEMTSHLSFEDSSNEESGFSDSTVHYQIDLEKVPKPISILGTFSHRKRFKEEVVSKIMLAQKETGRPLTQDEVDAMVYWLAKRQAIASWGTPFGFAGGALQAYRTIKTYKFPLWQPNPNIVEMILRGPFKSFPMSLCLHTARFLAYGLTGKLLGDIFFGSYAISNSTVGAANDPRLQNFMATIKQKMRSNIPQQPVKTTPAIANLPNQDAPNDVSAEGEVLNEKDEVEIEKSSRNITRFPLERQPRFVENSVPPSTSFQSESIESDPFEIFDNTISVEGHGKSVGLASTNSQISTWERIRRGEQVSQPRSSYSTQNLVSRRGIAKENFSPDEKFSFSKADEERSLVKDESQIEFDALLERERSGKFT